MTYPCLDLTHWGRVTHICVSKLTIIGSDNGLSPGRRQGIIWTNVGIWLIRLLGINFSSILIGIQTFSFKKMRLKMSCAKWRSFFLGLDVLSSSMSVKEAPDILHFEATRLGIETTVSLHNLTGAPAAVRSNNGDPHHSASRFRGIWR